MDFLQTVKERYSCRCFQERPVEESLIKSLTETAIRSPSWGNTQPWKIWAAGGKVAYSIRQGLIQEAEKGTPPCSEIPMPESFPDELKNRYKEVGKSLFAVLGIERDDEEKRNAHFLNNYNAFGAPSLVFFTVPEDYTSYTVMDIGAIVNAFCLAATEKGLATCIQAALVRYPDVVRQALYISPEERIVVGVALGYADKADKANGFRSARESVDDVLTLAGF